ncbi:MAG: polyprenyl synthetase family protein [Gemmatimonadales bacterium]
MRVSSVNRGLTAYLTDARTRVDTVLSAWSQRGDDVIRYSLLGEGKRLRPTLVFASHEALNGQSSAGIADLAAAVEVVHAYSLVHDDLPCMDDDDLRRGRPTAHRAFDVASATRAGYQMVALAARVLAHGLEALPLPEERRREIALELFRAAGAGGMIGGQALDLEAEAKTLPIRDLEEVHRRKTGALIAASCVIGGLSAGEGIGRGHIEALRSYGEAIGLAFQIADDVLDATATSDQLGKTAGKDAAHAKATFVTLLGVGAARVEAERLAAKAVAHLREAGLVSPTLVELAHYIVTRPN